MTRHVKGDEGIKQEKINKVICKGK